MHELAVTQSILEAVLACAQQHGAARVLRVNLLKGDLNDYVNDTLQFLFQTLAEGTPAAGAQLEVEELPITFHCCQCAADFTVARENFEALCPHCGSVDVELTGGREFYLGTIEIE